VGSNRDRGIAAVGAYAPLLRLDRASAVRALKFSGLGGRSAGFRAVAGWDEDALTLALEAARLANRKPDAVRFASTSAPDQLDDLCECRSPFAGEGLRRERPGYPVNLHRRIEPFQSVAATFPSRPSRRP
jgi:hypothetical protein